MSSHGSARIGGMTLALLILGAGVCLAVTGAQNVSAFYAECTPVPGDYDGDGLDDLSVYQAETGTWAVRYSGNGETAIFGPIGPGFVPAR